MQIAFSQRVASLQWEALLLPRLPGLALWAWYRPQHLPSGVTVAIPEALIASPNAVLPFSMSELLMSAGIPLNQFQAVSLFGGPWQPASTFLPYLNHPVPAVMPGGRPEIGMLVLESTPLAMPMPVLAPISDSEVVFAAPAGGREWLEDGLADLDDDDQSSDDAGQMYDRIEASWKASLQMERQMTGLRQKLSGLLNSLGKLDRDLSPEERLAAERDDRDAWEEARRWVRDLAGKCHREIKQFDIGMTSAAGRKNQMQQFYDQVIEPRTPYSDLASRRREFDTYRKDMSNLQRAMTTAAQAASQNGTQRAQRVLAVIGKKIRERRARMREPIGGVNMDKSCRRRK